ncbi:mucin-22-like isoform X2 [Branchiostoma lanceolatum]|uniref:mucin-22-like isoform X2 n=1 Tax=Branchiostoma lanceolatum TaxID=7740 RepID=UPI00345601DC
MRLASLVLLLFSWFAFATPSIDLDAAGQNKCSLDAGVCGWTVEGPVYHGGPAGCDYGWPNDAIHGVTAPGAYVCFFLDHLPAMYPGLDRARLTSPTFNTTHHVVMSFAVGTVRPPNGTYLNVILVNETGVETLLCSTSELLSPWQRIYVGIVQPGPYKILIEGVSDPPFYPNFGIDDLTLTVVENATANVGVQTTTCSTQLLTTVPMTTRQHNTTLPMTSSLKDDTTMPMAVSQSTTAFTQTSGQHVTTSPLTISKDTPTVQITNSQDTTIFPATDSQVETSPLTTSSQYMTTFPKTSSQDTTILPMTSSHDTTVLPMTSSQYTTVLPMTSSQYTTILSMTDSHDSTILTSSQDTSILPMTGSHDTTTLAMTGQDTTTFPPTLLSTNGMTTSPTTDILDTTTLPVTSSQKTSTLHMTTKQEDTTNTVSSFPTTNNFHPTTSQAETTSGISKNPTSKTTPQEETTKHPITSKTLLTTSKSGEVPTKSLPTNTTSKEGQLGQQSGRNNDPDITALPIVLGIAGFLLVAAGAMFYLRKIRKKSSFSVEESRRVSMMSLTHTELTEL